MNCWPIADEEQEKMLGSPGAHLILIFTRHVNEGRVERGSMYGKIRDFISLYRLFGSRGFMPCASIKILSAGLSKLAVPCKFANLPRESRNVRITALPYHPSSQKMIRVTFGVEEVA
jgi:hypothetical protein